MATSSQISRMYASRRLQSQKPGGSSGPAGPDSLVPTTTPYTGTYGPESIAIGTRFARNGAATLSLIGVQWWRSTTVQTDPPTIQYCAVGAGSSTVLKASTAGAPGVAGWETILFDTAIPISDNAQRVVWVVLAQGGYPATPAYFAAPVVSTGGKFTSPIGAGVFAQPPPTGTSEPATSFNNGFYWVTPLVN